MTTSFRLRKTGKGTVLAEYNSTLPMTHVMQARSAQDVRKQVMDAFYLELAKTDYVKDDGPVLVEAQANFDGEYEYRIVAYVKKMKEAA